MKRRAAFWLALAPALAAAAPNLCIELRETGASTGGWQVGTADARAARERAPQRVCVQSGETASFAIDVARPVQVWEASPGTVLPIPVPTTQWLHAGQRLEVRPRWAGGKAPVRVELAAVGSRFDASVAEGSAQPPQRTQTHVRTTLEVPPGQWVAFASSGDAAPDAGSVSTSQARSRRVLELRVERAP